MNLPSKCPSDVDREKLFKIFCALVPSVSELRNYYLLKSQSGRLNLPEVGIYATDLSRFKSYGVCSKVVMCRLYMYYWLDVFSFNRDIFDYTPTSELPWIKRYKRHNLSE